jgi:hypothetical protein
MPPIPPDEEAGAGSHTDSLSRNAVEAARREIADRLLSIWYRDPERLRAIEPDADRVYLQLETVVEDYRPSAGINVGSTQPFVPGTANQPSAPAQRAVERYMLDIASRDDRLQQLFGIDPRSPATQAGRWPTPLSLNRRGSAAERLAGMPAIPRNPGLARSRDTGPIAERQRTRQEQNPPRRLRRRESRLERRRDTDAIFDERRDREQRNTRRRRLQKPRSAVRDLIEDVRNGLIADIDELKNRHPRLPKAQIRALKRYIKHWKPTPSDTMNLNESYRPSARYAEEANRSPRYGQDENRSSDNSPTTNLFNGERLSLSKELIKLAGVLVGLALDKLREWRSADATDRAWARSPLEQGMAHGGPQQFVPMQHEHLKGYAARSMLAGNNDLLAFHGQLRRTDALIARTEPAAAYAMVAGAAGVDIRGTSPERQRNAQTPPAVPSQRASLVTAAHSTLTGGTHLPGDTRQSRRQPPNSPSSYTPPARSVTPVSRQSGRGR